MASDENKAVPPLPAPEYKPLKYLRGKEAILRSQTPHSPTIQPVPPPPVILGLDTDTGQPVYVTQADLSQGSYIVGVQGMGKTSLLEQSVYQQMQRDEAIIVIDPHGDLVNSIIAHMPERRLPSTYLLDLKDRVYPFGLTAFTCRNPDDEEERDTTRSQIMHAFEKLWPETREGQYFNKMLRHVIITLLEHPELTLADVRRLLLDADYRNRYTRHLRNSESRQYWQMEYNELSDSKRQTESSPLRSRLDQLLTEPVINAILRQTQKPLNIRELIEERAILLVKLPVNEEAYKYSSPVIGTFLMSMIYSATFSFADVPLEARPGFTLIVDEFQNFATDEYAKLFEQGRKYKVKQFLAHQHRQQIERGSTAKTNLAATLSANTLVAFRTITHDSRELASLFSGITARRRPTDISIHPLEKIDEYPHPTVKQFVLDVVDRLDDAAGQKLETRREWRTDYFGRYDRVRRSYPERSYTYKMHPEYDFGAGSIQADPKKAEYALILLNRLIYESEERNEVVHTLRQQFIDAVTPFWKLTIEQPDPKKPEEAAEAKVRYTRFARLLDAVLFILVHSPIAEDKSISNTDIAGMLEDLEKREAFVKTGSTSYAIETRDTRLLQAPTTANEAARRLLQVREQTRARYCVPRRELEEQEAEEREEAPQPEREETEENETLLQREEPQPQVPVSETPAEWKPWEAIAVRLDTAPMLSAQRRELEAHEAEERKEAPQPEGEEIKAERGTSHHSEEPQPEPLERGTDELKQTEAPQPEVPVPEIPVERQLREPIAASLDTANMLYVQMKTKAIDPDTTILASLGEHYVLTIKQWMRLFEWRSYPRATHYFKDLRVSGLIYRKDREGRGGKLVEGDWFFLLTKGANELVKRKQAPALFTLEPNEAERASGDTLFHTYLVNELLIHLRLLERYHPELFKIEGIDHERSMRRNYRAALGSDMKFYPDGFLRLLVPTPNGLKRRYTFLELQHTTQKDEANWKTKCRKYLALFDRAPVLEKYFHTRTPRVLVITMSAEYAMHHKRWTEEVLAETRDRGRGYSNRFLIGAYDDGISDMRVPPEQFFCTPRFSIPFQKAAYPVFEM